MCDVYVVIYSIFISQSNYITVLEWIWKHIFYSCRQNLDRSKSFQSFSFFANTAALSHFILKCLRAIDVALSKRICVCMLFSPWSQYCFQFSRKPIQFILLLLLFLSAVSICARFTHFISEHKWSIFRLIYHNLHRSHPFSMRKICWILEALNFTQNNRY